MLLTLLRMRGTESVYLSLDVPLQEILWHNGQITGARPRVIYTLANTSDYSSYGYQLIFSPFGEAGEHELECYAIASSPEFPQILSPVVSARFTGQCPGEFS
jgi:hypothetical protein